MSEPTEGYVAWLNLKDGLIASLRAQLTDAKALIAAKDARLWDVHRAVTRGDLHAALELLDASLAALTPEIRRGDDSE